MTQAGRNVPRASYRGIDGATKPSVVTWFVIRYTFSEKGLVVQKERPSGRSFSTARASCTGQPGGNRASYGRMPGLLPQMGAHSSARGNDGSREGVYPSTGCRLSRAAAQDERGVSFARRLAVPLSRSLRVSRSPCPPVALSDFAFHAAFFEFLPSAMRPSLSGSSMIDIASTVRYNLD